MLQQRRVPAMKKFRFAYEFSRCKSPAKWHHGRFQAAIKALYHVLGGKLYVSPTKWF